MTSNRELWLAFNEIISHLQSTENTLDGREVGQFIRKINSAGRIFVYGAGRSGYVARSFAQRLMQLDYHAFFVGETSTPAGRKGDLLIVVTGSGQTPSVVSMLKSARNLKMNTIVVTSSREGEAAKEAGSVLYVPGKTKLLERRSHAPFTSLFDVATLSVLDSITAELMKKKGMTDEVIGRTHANLE